MIYLWCWPKATQRRDVLASDIGSDCLSICLWP